VCGRGSRGRLLDSDFVWTLVQTLRLRRREHAVGERAARLIAARRARNGPRPLVGQCEHPHDAGALRHVDADEPAALSSAPRPPEATAMYCLPSTA